MGNANSNARKRASRPFHKMVYDFFIVENFIGLSAALVFATLLTAVVTYFLDGIIFSTIGWYTSGKSMRNLFYSFNGTSYNTLDDARTAGAPVLAWGAFIEASSEFILAALTVFVVVMLYRQFAKSTIPLRQVSMGEMAVLGAQMEHNQQHI